MGAPTVTAPSGPVPAGVSDSKAGSPKWQQGVLGFSYLQAASSGLISPINQIS